MLSRVASLSSRGRVARLPRENYLKIAVLAVSSNVSSGKIDFGDVKLSLGSKSTWELVRSAGVY